MHSRRLAAAVVCLASVGLLPLAACAPAASGPAPAQQRTTPPPWPAPRDAVSYIAAAGLSAQRLDYRPASRGTLALRVTYAGQEVAVPARIGEDRVRALTAGLHTHDETATVYLEPPEAEAGKPYTLGELFTLWGVRLTDRCLADRCAGVRVDVSGEPVTVPAPQVPLRAGTTVTVAG